MKICNPLVYTLGVMMLTLHIVSWFDAIMNGFTTSSVLTLIMTFVTGTYEIVNSIEFDTSRKDDNNNE